MNDVVVRFRPVPAPDPETCKGCALQGLPSLCESTPCTVIEGLEQAIIYKLVDE